MWECEERKIGGGKKLIMWDEKGEERVVKTDLFRTSAANKHKACFLMNNLLLYIPAWEGAEAAETER